MGADARFVGAGVVANAVGVVVSGSLLGSGGVLLLAAAADRWVPVVALAIEPADLVGVQLLFIAVGVAASILPVLRLRRIDPVDAFRP